MDAVERIATLNTGVATPDAGARHVRLLHAAQQFEAVMLGELMKPLAANGAIGEDADTASPNPMQSFGVESMAGALARSGTLGFARRIVTSLETR